MTDNLPTVAARVAGVLCDCAVAVMRTDTDYARLCGRLFHEADALDAAAADAAKEESRHEAKWREYERDYILPCFKWAEEIGFDLHAAVEKNPGKNCVHLLVEHLRGLAAAAKQSCEWEARGDKDDPIFFSPCGFWSYEPADELKCPCCRCKDVVTVKVTGAKP